MGFGFNYARPGDQEEGGVRAELDVGDREAARWWHVWVNGCGNRLCGNERYFNFELRREDGSHRRNAEGGEKDEDATINRWRVRLWSRAILKMWWRLAGGGDSPSWRG